MSRNDTIELLNETDDLERRMSWIDFHTEQNARLWRPVKGDHNWRPGQALHQHPRALGNPARDLIEVSYEADSLHRSWQWVHPHWCRECQVGWRGDQRSCWACGRLEDVHTDEDRDPWDSNIDFNWTDLEPVELDEFGFIAEPSRAPVEKNPYDFGLISYAPLRLGPDDPLETWMRNRMREGLDRQFQRRLLGRPVEQFGEEVVVTAHENAISGVRFNVETVVFDEAEFITIQEGVGRPETPMTHEVWRNYWLSGTSIAEEPAEVSIEVPAEYSIQPDHGFPEVHIEHAPIPDPSWYRHFNNSVTGRRRRELP